MTDTVTRIWVDNGRQVIILKYRKSKMADIYLNDESQNNKITTQTFRMSGEDAIEEEDLKVHADLAVPDGILRAVNAKYNLIRMGNEETKIYDVKSGGTYK